ncbi:hypothetical protein FJZ31_14490 [Candidatus Poribacteria bacterium]|nr:hypothetical protein [Candidatus Poribacteria bacterium]
MAKSFFKAIAQDLLKLEINTIIKSDMSAVKMPASKRQALYEVARDYDKKLKELKVREPIYWEYAGIRSFGELRDRAKEGIKKLEEKYQDASQEEQQDIRENLKMLERIEYQSSSIVGMFKEIEQNIASKKRRLQGYSEPPETPKQLTEADRPPESHKASQMWNNDISRSDMNMIENLDLTPDHITLIRKAWEISTEPIILQTVIQVDGDVTTRISERFARNLNEAILNIHKDSIDTSTRFWANLVKILGEMAGKAFRAILR